MLLKLHRQKRRVPTDNGDDIDGSSRLNTRRLEFCAVAGRDVAPVVAYLADLQTQISKPDILVLPVNCCLLVSSICLL